MIKSREIPKNVDVFLHYSSQKTSGRSAALKRSTTSAPPTIPCYSCPHPSSSQLLGVLLSMKAMLLPGICVFCPGHAKLRGS